MCRTITTKDFRKLIEKAERGRPAGILMDYLESIGYIIAREHGNIEAVENIEERIDFIIGQVEPGDIVWTHTKGLYLVIDVHPREDNDGHHFRGIKVALDADGTFTINPEQRTIILDDKLCLRTKSTKFDTPHINDLCFERYELFTRIAKINNELLNMKEDVDAK